MNIEVCKQGKISILRLSGKMTLSSGLGSALRRTFDDLLGTGERHFVLAINDVGYVDSAGLGDMVACHQKVGDHGGALRIVVDPRSSTSELLTLTHLDRELNVYTEQSDALDGLGG